MLNWASYLIATNNDNYVLFGASVLKAVDAGEIKQEQMRPFSIGIWQEKMTASLWKSIPISFEYSVLRPGNSTS